jgi:hypothetical protein
MVYHFPYVGWEEKKGVLRLEPNTAELADFDIRLALTPVPFK